MQRCLASLVLFALSASGCQTIWSQQADSRSVSFFYASLFNQRAPSKLVPKPWAGDWLFRRERLLIVDRFLRERKPDIVLFQEAMAREGDSAESDLRIIGRGSLNGYSWNSYNVANYSDTHENEYHAVAAGLPLQVVNLSGDFKRAWPLAEGGRLTFFLVELGGIQIPIFSVEMKDLEQNTADYLFLGDTIAAILEQFHFCPLRTIIVGRMSTSYTSNDLATFMERLGLKDASEGYCEIASDCYTASSLNENYMNTTGGNTPSQTDYLLVHKSTSVSAFSIELRGGLNNKEFMDDYGLSKVWPTERFGLLSALKLNQCDDDDYLDAGAK